jgi:hypothetical protein
VPLRVKIILLVLTLVSIGLTVVALNNSVTGDSAAGGARVDGVESFTPSPGSNVLKQTTVSIDLKEGYDAYFVIDGITIQNAAQSGGDDGLRKVPGLAIVEYQPGPDRRITELPTPDACVDAYVWKIANGRSSAQLARWCFKTS